MITNSDFRFTINVSNDGYHNKKQATASLSSKGAAAIGIKKMCFFEHNITTDDLIQYAYNGHAFCNLFQLDKDKKYWYSNSKGQKFLGYAYYRRNTKTSTKDGLKIDFKRNEYFTGSQVVFVDIDETKFENVSDYIDCLTYKPTFVYMSYSDATVKNTIYSRRFHLVYVFDEILNKDEFIYCSTNITKQIELDTNETIVDDCGERISQYMNGCYGNDEMYVTYSIYSKDDITEVKTTLNEIEIEDNTTTTTINVKTENPTTFNTTIVNDFDRLVSGSITEDEFFKCREWETLRQQTKYIYRVEKEEWINNTYQFIDEDYFSLFWHVNTVKDGSKRRRNLYERMCLRRVIKPEITPNELMFNTIVDITRFFDNSDKVLNGDFLIRNITNCFAHTIDEIKSKYAGEIKFLKENTKPKKGIIYKNKKAHSKETTYLILDEIYNKELSVKDNLIYINEVEGYLIKKDTIYNYIKDRNLKTDTNKLTDQELINLTDYSKSANENYKFIKSKGLKISKDRYFKFYKSNKNNNTRTTTVNVNLENKESITEMQDNTFKFYPTKARINTVCEFRDFDVTFDRSCLFNNIVMKPKQTEVETIELGSKHYDKVDSLF